MPDMGAQENCCGRSRDSRGRVGEEQGVGRACRTESRRALGELYYPAREEEPLEGSLPE